MVLKKGDALDQARGYLELIQFHPFIGEHMAPIYGTIDGWVVVGRLVGLSYEEIEDRMRNDSLFINEYVEDVFALFDKVVEAGLRINDVSFQDGHNIFYNDEYRRIYFMEHKAIQPAVQQTQPLEVLFKLLDGEVSKAIPSQGGGEYPRPERLMFAFRLMQLAFAAHDPSLYYFRPIMLRVDHPEFRRAYEEQFLMDRDHLPMTDEEYSDLLAHPHGANGREILMPSSFVSPFLGGRMRSNGAAHGFSNEFIQAVLEGDFERFSNLVLARDFVIPLNEQDPRSFPNILKS